MITRPTSLMLPRFEARTSSSAAGRVRGAPAGGRCALPAPVEPRSMRLAAFGWLPDYDSDRDVMLRQLRAFNRGSRLIICALLAQASFARCDQPQALCELSKARRRRR